MTVYAVARGKLRDSGEGVHGKRNVCDIGSTNGGHLETGATLGSHPLSPAQRSRRKGISQLVAPDDSVGHRRRRDHRAIADALPLRLGAQPLRRSSEFIVE